jgi:hypothetical protein
MARPGLLVTLVGPLMLVAVVGWRPCCISARSAFFSADRLSHDDIGDAPVKPASNRGPRNLQLGKQTRIAGLADPLSNAVAVAASSAEGPHHTRIGRPNIRGTQQRRPMNSGMSPLQRFHFRMSSMRKPSLSSTMFD